MEPDRRHRLHLFLGEIQLVRQHRLLRQANLMDQHGRQKELRLLAELLITKQQAAQHRHLLVVVCM